MANGFEEYPILVKGRDKASNKDINIGNIDTIQRVKNRRISLNQN